MLVPPSSSDSLAEHEVWSIDASDDEMVEGERQWGGRFEGGRRCRRIAMEGSSAAENQYHPNGFSVNASSAADFQKASMRLAISAPFHGPIPAICLLCELSTQWIWIRSRLRC